MKKVTLNKALEPERPIQAIKALRAAAAAEGEPMAYGPHEPTVEAVARATSRDPVIQHHVAVGIRRMYGPANGLDASICKRAVVALLDAEADTYDEDDSDGLTLYHLARRLEREWGNA